MSRGTPLRRITSVGAVLLALASCGGSSAPSPAAGGPRALRVTGDPIDGRAWLTSASARAIAAGAGPIQVIGADIAAEGDRIGAFVEIPEGECALALGRGSPTVSDIDLFSYEDDGSTFATDETPQSEASVLICPPHPRRLYVVARLMSGTGVVAVGIQSVPRAAAEAVARAVGARGRPGEDTGRLESWPGLETKIREHRSRLGSRWEEVRRVAMPVDPRVATRVSLSLDAGRCIDVLVTPSDEVASLEVVAEDATGRIVARARDRGRDRLVVLCSAIATSVSLAVRPRASQGLVAVIVGRSGVGAEPEISQRAWIEHVSETRELPDARASHERALQGRGYGAAKTVATGAARVGHRVTVPVELPAGCARIDVLAGKPLVSVDAQLWDERGSRIGEARGGALAALFACGQGGPARLDVEALARPGPFAVEIRRDKAAPPALVARPVAAARLLDRMNAGGQAVDLSTMAPAHVLALDDQTMKVVPVPVAPGTCAEVTVAVDAGGRGVDLRLVDRATGESTLTRARYVVADRICAGTAAIAAAAEVRLAAGKADVLLVVRPIPP